MKTTIPALAAAVAVLLAVAPCSVTADDVAADEACLLATHPGEPHAFLAKLAGNWTYSGSYWPDPSGTPFEVSGTSEMEMAFDGRYLVERVTSEIPGGMLFQGIAYSGFDNAAGYFTRVWMDNSNTMLSLGTGNLDETGRVLTLSGEFTDPATGDKGSAKSVTRFLDDDRYVVEFWSSIGGAKSVKGMELEYRRDSGA